MNTRGISAVVALGAAVILASQASAGDPTIFFTSRPAFSTFAAQQGKTQKGIENFEYAQMSGGKVAFPDPLDANTPSTPFPNGLLSHNLRIQTNRNPGPFAAQDVPSANPQALFVVAPGAFGSNSFKVGEDLGILAGIHCSMDLIFTSGDKTAVGFDLSRFQGFGDDGWTIGVFSLANVLIGQMTIPGPVVNNPLKNFVGVWSPVPIGRINIFDPNLTSPDAVDNIEMWAIPAPSAMAYSGA